MQLPAIMSIPDYRQNLAEIVYFKYIKGQKSVPHEQADMPDIEVVETIGKVLNDSSRPLKERFRALFTLRSLGGEEAIDAICASFADPSALLKHECAYCLGQMQDKYAIPKLVSVLTDTEENPMVRHEAGEALGAIGSADVLELLHQYSKDPVTEVAETCQLAAARIEWLHSTDSKHEKLSENPYLSVDPAPPSVDSDINSLRDDLLNENLPLFQRYRAMFSLRNMANTKSVQALAEGLKCKSALFRHEIAYVLGQLQHPAASEALKNNLADEAENPMVRHECAEALGAIATDDAMKVLEQFVKDKETVVKESCEVALDMCEYEHSNDFEYADALHKMKKDSLAQCNS